MRVRTQEKKQEIIRIAAKLFDELGYERTSMLSMVAALQAPLIMMSQNRQAKKDRLEARIDSETNAHAAGEIGLVQDKLDLLMNVLLNDQKVRASVLDLIQRSKIN